MNISVSSLSFCGHPIYNMKELPQDYGIEIFYEWGGETYWKLALAEIMDNRQGQFSIHGPYQGWLTELSLVANEEKLFDYLKEPFDLYHQFNGDGYVVHMNAPYNKALSPQEKEERLKRVQDRLNRFNEICMREGVEMLVENLAFGQGKYTLCDQQAFLDIFEQNPKLNCIIDTGHALLGDINIGEVQKALKERIKAYHIHDNDGKNDLHQRIEKGILDWETFKKDAKVYTPNANFVLEYNLNAVEKFENYLEDGEKMKQWIKW